MSRLSPHLQYDYESRAQNAPELSNFGFTDIELPRPPTRQSDNSSGPTSPRRLRPRGDKPLPPQGLGKDESFPWGKTEGSTTGTDELSPGLVRALVDPPRTAREGSEWVWFPEGYWAERDIAEINPKKRPWFHRKSSSKSALRGPKSPEAHISPNRSISSRGDRRKGSRARSSSQTHSDILEESKPAVQKLDLQTAVPPPTRSSTEEANVEIVDSQHVAEETEPRASLFMRGLQRMSPSIRNSEGSSERAGLYSKTKSKFKSGFSSKRKTPFIDEPSSLAKPGELRSRTTTLLQETSGYLARIQSKRSQAGKAVSPGTSSNDSRASRRHFGLAPWHRQNSQDTLMSVSSSLHKMLMGPTPAATPIQQPEAKQAQDIDITDPKQSSFLKTEAQRIYTPPLPQLTPQGQPRGFFFELPSPQEDPSKDSVRKSYSSPRAPLTSPGVHGIRRTRPARSPGAREWFDPNISVSSRSLISTESTPGAYEAGPGFELNVPEHLANSPLCPASPFHKSRGTGICPYHGRRRNPPRVESMESDDSSVQVLLRTP